MKTTLKLIVTITAIAGAAFATSCGSASQPDAVPPIEVIDAK